jgi:hypothetical protein
MKKMENFISFELGDVQSKNVFGGECSGPDDSDDEVRDSAGGWHTGEGGILVSEGGPLDYVRNGYYFVTYF